jgi:hypothetical protein
MNPMVHFTLNATEEKTAARNRFFFQPAASAALCLRTDFAGHLAATARHPALSPFSLAFIFVLSLCAKLRDHATKPLRPKATFPYLSTPR